MLKFNEATSNIVILSNFHHQIVVVIKLQKPCQNTNHRFHHWKKNLKKNIKDNKKKTLKYQ